MLKALRLQLARERGVPAYVVFSDRSLIDVVHGATAARADGLEERHLVSDANRVLMRHGKCEGLGEFADCLHAALLAVLLRQNVFLGRWQQADMFHPTCW